MTTSRFHIRPVKNTIDDMNLLSGFCHELAAFDGHRANMDGAKLQRQLFGFDTNVRAFLAYLGQEAIGFILC